MRLSPTVRLSGMVALVPLFILLGNSSCKPKNASELAAADSLSAAGCPSTRPTSLVYSGDKLVSWVDGKPITGDWTSEIKRREDCIQDYFRDTDPGRAQKYGFNMDHGKSASDPAQNPALAWNWFSAHPVGFVGLPFVLLKTILDLRPEDHDPASDLGKIARIWHRLSKMPYAGKRGAYTVDHIGLGPNQEDYVDGVALPPERRKHPLPNGLVYEGLPTDQLPRSHLPSLIISEKLFSFKVFGAAELARVKLQSHFDGPAAESYADDLKAKRLQKPGGLDEVFFSCVACHQGRVMVGNRMKFMPGMPNTEVEAQYYSKLLMLTAAALTESGFDINQPSPIDPSKIKPKTSAIVALLRAMVDKARNNPETLYGPSDEQKKRARLQVLNVAEKFPEVAKELIATGAKTHFVYVVAAKQNSYKAALPDVFEDRPGQMDAFGVAAGLVGIHTRRPDNSFINFVFYQNRDNPLLKGFPNSADLPSFARPTPKDDAGKRIFEKMNEWLPLYPAAIDVRSLAFAKDNALANWDGNQDASARTLASGTSATGDPRKVNVRIHEPLNAFINNLPPAPYPFPSVDMSKATAGKAIFNQKCLSCHAAGNDRVYTIKELDGVDDNRSKITSNVTRYGLAAINLESCVIYATQNNGAPGYNWCIPKQAACKVPATAPTAEPNPAWCKPEVEFNALVDDYFKPIPDRIIKAQNGYKADVLHGIWARAPYLHNGSVPTLGHLLCPTVRPAKFLRGNVNYDEKLVGFEWGAMPEKRYGPYDVIQVKEFDTSLSGRHNSGHTFGSKLCPSELQGMDPLKDRAAIEAAIAKSDAGKVIEFLKTL